MKQNRIEDTKINPHNYNHLIIFEKEPKAYIGEKTASSTNVAGNTGCPHSEDRPHL
jgi:hypothetical protein